MSHDMQHPVTKKTRERSFVHVRGNFMLKEDFDSNFKLFVQEICRKTGIKDLSDGYELSLLPPLGVKEDPKAPRDPKAPKIPKVSLGRGFLHIHDSRVWHVLMGRSTGGKERVNHRPVKDSEWKQPLQSVEERVVGELWGPRPKSMEDLLDSSLATDSWADLVEKEEEIRSLYERPTIEVKLPPMVPFPAIIHSEERKAKNIEDANRLIDLRIKDHEKLIEAIENYGTVEFEPAMPKCITDTERPSVLTALDLPPWITDQDLWKLFSPFTTYEGETEYPRITRHGRVTKIQYRAGTQDGYYALMVRKAFEYQKGDNKKFLSFKFEEYKV